MVCLLIHDFILIEKPHGIFVYFIHLSHTECKLLIKIVINKSIMHLFLMQYCFKDVYGCVCNQDVVCVLRVHPGLQGEMA